MHKGIKGFVPNSRRQLDASGLIFLFSLPVLLRMPSFRRIRSRCFPLFGFSHYLIDILDSDFGVGVGCTSPGS